MSASRALHPIALVAALLGGCGTNHLEVIERLDVAAVSSSSAPDVPIGPSASSAAVPTAVPIAADAGGGSVGSPTAPLATDTGPCGPPGLVSEPRYRLTLRSNGSCMGVGAATTSEGRQAFTSTVAADCGVHDLWQLVQVPGSYYEIRNLTTGLTLETFNGLGAVGTDLVLMTPENELAQHFEIRALTDEYFSINARVGAGHCDEAQQWRFEAQACVESDTLGDAGL
jgi:hypothetical protein